MERYAFAYAGVLLFFISPSASLENDLYKFLEQNKDMYVYYESASVYADLYYSECITTQNVNLNETYYTFRRSSQDFKTNRRNWTQFIGTLGNESQNSTLTIIDPEEAEGVIYTLKHWVEEENCAVFSVYTPLLDSEEPVCEMHVGKEKVLKDLKLCREHYFRECRYVRKVFDKLCLSREH
ncbi:uncharacterized protein LOC144140908 [Haemaphysalis longicornis]